MNPEHEELKEEVERVERKLDAHVIEYRVTREADAKMQVHHEKILDEIKIDLRSVRQMVVTILATLLLSAAGVWTYIELKAGDRYTGSRHATETVPRLDRIENELHKHKHNSEGGAQ